MARLSFPDSQTGKNLSQPPSSQPTSSQPTMIDDSKKSKKAQKHKNQDSDAISNGINTPVTRKRGVGSIAKNKRSKQNGHGSPNMSSTPAQMETPSGTPASVERTPRGSRVAENGLKVGFFEEDETRKLEQHKVDFCNLHGISATTFDAMVQHSRRDQEDFPCPTELCTKTEFWSGIYNLLPERERRSVYRFVHRHFQDSTQKPHQWTPEQDEELVELYETYGPKHTYIAKMLGRSDDDVTQRWKNRLEHRATMQTGSWSAAELHSLVQEVERFAEGYRKIGGSAVDEYDLDEKIIPWSQISNGMGNARSRQQCADKWRKIRKSVLQMRSSQPDATFDPDNPPVRAKGKRSSDAAPTNVKSNEYIDESDNDGDENEDAAGEGSGAEDQASEGSNVPTSGQPEAESDSQAGSDIDMEDTGKSQESMKSKKSNGTKGSLSKAELAEAQAKEEKKKAKRERKEERKRRRSMKEAENADSDAASPERTKKQRKSALKHTGSEEDHNYGGEPPQKNKSKGNKKANGNRNERFSTPDRYRDSSQDGPEVFHSPNPGMIKMEE